MNKKELKLYGIRQTTLVSRKRITYQTESIGTTKLRRVIVLSKLLGKDNSLFLDSCFNFSACGCHESGFKHGFFPFIFTANSLPVIPITLHVQSDNFRKTLRAEDQNSLNLLATPGLRAESCIYTRPPGLFVIPQANNTNFSSYNLCTSTDLSSSTNTQVSVYNKL